MAAGLGPSAVRSGAKRWDAHVQRACGAGPHDYSSWRFEEVAGEWEFLGINQHVGMAMDKKLRARERETQLRVLDSVLPTTYPPPCSPGTFASARGMDRVCEPCTAGSFCAGGQALTGEEEARNRQINTGCRK
ncbi:hypothetical protein T484DRAFT_1859332 [Baffinella frigidus]|nr:hypothetical protein T484DRAFT_1859332 [Cryptophyta sp. CCMP2293]